MMKSNIKLISERWIKVRVGETTSLNKQTDLGKLENRVNIYMYKILIDRAFNEGNIITTRNQRMATRALLRTTNKFDAWARERELTFSPSKTVSIKCILVENFNTLR